MKGIFITGTDTDVGKTWVAAGLTVALRQRGVKAVYFKPVQSGCPETGGRLIPTDADFARNLAGLTEPLEVLTPIALRLPLAPGVAAAQAGVVVDLEIIAASLRDLAERYDFFVVEGAGGLYVTLVGTHFLVLDLIRWLGLPLAVVAHSGLGTINHTVLTVKAAQAAGIESSPAGATPGGNSLVVWSDLLVPRLRQDWTQWVAALVEGTVVFGAPRCATGSRILCMVSRHVLAGSPGKVWYSGSHVHFAGWRN